MPDTDKLTLCIDSFWISPYAFSCFVALREKGLAFEVREIALHRGEQHDRGYRDRSLTAKVPTLVHGDFWLSESMAIVEYLDDVFGGPGRARALPEDVRERARARQVMAWIRTDMVPLREARPTRSLFYERTNAPLGEAARAAADKLIRVASELVRGPDLPLFATWSVADTDLALMLQRLVANGDEVPAPLREWAVREWARPSVRELVEHPRAPYVPH
jgi:glutathione S-transferase